MTNSATRQLHGQTLGTRLTFEGLRLLAWANGLEAALGMLAIAFACGCLFFDAPMFSGYRYPLAEQISYVLAATGIATLVALNQQWRPVRVATSLMAFMAWGMLALGSLAAFADVGQRYGFLFSTLSALELGVFLRLHLRMEGMQDTLDATVLANNITFEQTGSGIPAKDDTQGTDDARPPEIPR